MFILRQNSVKMAVLLHKQAKVPFILIIAVCICIKMQENEYLLEAFLIVQGRGQVKNGIGYF